MSSFVNGMLLVALVMMAGPAWGQQAAPSDTIRVIRVEHSRAGEYAKAGFGLGAASGALGWIVWTSARGDEGNVFGDTPYERRRNLKEAAKWSAVSAGFGVLIGAVVGSGERWTEEYLAPARLGVVPLADGAMLALAFRWP